jgi:hypothetical protein
MNHNIILTYTATHATMSRGLRSSAPPSTPQRRSCSLAFWPVSTIYAAVPDHQKSLVAHVISYESQLTVANSNHCHTSAKRADNSFICHTSKIIRLKVLCLPHIRKKGGVPLELLTRRRTSGKPSRKGPRLTPYPSADTINLHPPERRFQLHFHRAAAYFHETRLF